MGADGVVALAFSAAGIGVLAEAALRSDVGDSEPAARCRSSAAARCVGAEHAASLRANGYFVIDGAVSARACAAAAADAARVHALRGSPAAFAAERGDDVCWIRAAGDGEAPLARDTVACVDAVRGVAAALQAAGYETAVDFLVPAQCQLARYDAGKRGYARHLDRCDETLSDLGLLGWLRASDYRRRALTCILYLNDMEGQGGELRLYLGGPDAETPRVDVAPRAGRLLVFESGRLEHEVLAARAPRFALTNWVATGWSCP